MTSNQYDTVIIGAGHNGLVAAAYFAKAKKRVLVLERRAIAGGSLVTESFGSNPLLSAEGFQADSIWTGGTLRPDIIKYLNLASHGLQPDSVRKPFISLQTNSNHLVLDSDPAKAAESIKHFSEKDAAKWHKFIAFMNKSAQFLDAAYATIMPRLPKKFSFEEGYGLLEMGLDLRLMGRKDMLNLVRMLPMTAVEFMEEWFESEQLKAAIASVAIHGVTLGVMSAGTGYTLLHNWMNRGGLSHINVGKAGEITQALTSAVKSLGGEIRTEAEVTKIRVDRQEVKGVILANGEEISAKVVLSAADPKHTLLKLVGAMELPPEFVRKTQSIKMRGSVAKIHLLTNGNHGIPEGTLVLAPNLQYLERAYDTAKYGQISEKPYLEITTSGNVVSVHFQFAPYTLKNGDWKTEGAKVENLAIDTLGEYFPNLKSSTLMHLPHELPEARANAVIIDHKTITPKDLEETYGLTEGDLNHGQLMLDQFLFMRPIPGWSNHKTPIDGLYLCGSGAHGGGGVSGASGRNAARMVLNNK
ncbi:MAG: NAD(P)/FAD-dependent oxidoreductase [Chloroflexi bacterium]|nr:NAD(P)/FAD-dependent oxidoreductase [Chloroflexota bacterium]